jgi:hypothetical protein
VLTGEIIFDLTTPSQLFLSAKVEKVAEAIFTSDLLPTKLRTSVKKASLASLKKSN